jgi:hypothetical protein
MVSKAMKEDTVRQEPSGRSTLRLQPVMVFRSALAEAAAKERASRPRRRDRIEAIATLTDRDLVSLTEQFDTLLRASADASELAADLHAALRALSPEEPVAEEFGDA